MPYPFASTYPSASTWPGFTFGVEPTTGETTDASLQHVDADELRLGRGWIPREAVLVKTTTREWPT